MNFDSITRTTLTSVAIALCVQSTCYAQQTAVDAQSPSKAATFDYGVSGGIGYSDNIQRTATDKKGEGFASLGLDLAYNADSRTLFSKSTVDVVYLDYLKHTYNSEVVGNANIDLDARISPGQFEWLLQDNFGQIRSDPFAPSSPANRENINYFTTGPQLTAHFSNTTRGQLTAQYSTVTYQRSNFADNNRYGALVALIRDLSSVSHVSLNVSSERTNYKNDSPVGVDYDTRNAYFDFSVNGARTKATADLGYTQIKRAGETTSGTLARLQLQRQVTSSSTLTLNGGRELTSSGDVFRSVQDALPISADTQSTTQAVDPIVRKYAQLGWDFARARTGLGFSVMWSDEAHQVQSSLDRKGVIGSAYISRAITPNLNARLLISYDKENYYTANVDSRDLSEGVAFAWRTGKLLTTSFQVQHYNRSSNIPSTDYSENRAWLQLTYGNARPLMQ